MKWEIRRNPYCIKNTLVCKSVFFIIALGVKNLASKNGSYMKKKKKKTISVTGSYIGTNREFGFVHCEELEEDIFIPPVYINGAMHGDTVVCEILPGNAEKGKRKEGRIVNIEDHAIKEVVGTYEKSKHYGFVIPDNSKIQDDIFIPKEKAMGAVDGHKVVARITTYPRKGRSPEGEIIRILGHINDPGVDILSIVEAFGIPHQFPSKVLNQAERIPDELNEGDYYGRKDLRSLCMVTIDGEDSKDLDDAVSIEKTEDGYILGVHIADVSNYVQESSALDKEALKRGTSVYLCDRVIPMLPHKLSNGICSLNEGEDRLALSCMMQINEKGVIISHEIAESVINVNRRMTYTAVAAIVEAQDEDVMKEYHELCPMFFQMKELSALLRKNREKRGSIDFDLPETKLVVDENGKPVEIKPYDRNLATKMIEDFMLAANETVASHFFWEEVPFVYRVHETPDPDKIKQLEILIRNFGYHFKSSQEEIHPKELQKLLCKIGGTPEETLISRITLRSMKQAQYSVACDGHFGLAAKYYCHFTSPIRRYPDLQIHRIIKDEIRGRLNEKKRAHYEAVLPAVAKQSSDTERRASETERETNKLKKCQYMMDYIGEEFEGIISGITSYGIYVELPNTVEGMIRVANLMGDQYTFDDKKYELKGMRSNRIFRLGEPIKVIMNSADEVMRTIDFILPEELTEGKRRYYGKK